MYPHRMIMFCICGDHWDYHERTSREDVRGACDREDCSCLVFKNQASRVEEEHERINPTPPRPREPVRDYSRACHYCSRYGIIWCGPSGLDEYCENCGRTS